MNIYEEILTNIDADKKAWCQEDWYTKDDDGKPVSRCLVEHVDLAVGTTYVKPNGKVFVSKDPKKWNRRARVVAHLANLLPDVHKGLSYDGVYRPQTYTRDDMSGLGKRAWGKEIVRRPGFDDAAEDLVEFNDDDKTTKAKVRSLLRKAAKRHPED